MTFCFSVLNDLARSLVHFAESLTINCFAESLDGAHYPIIHLLIIPGAAIKFFPPAQDYYGYLTSYHVSIGAAFPIALLGSSSHMIR